MNVLNIVEIIVLILIFIRIYVLYRQKKSLKITRVILVSFAAIIVLTHLDMHKSVNEETVGASCVDVSNSDTTPPVITLKGSQEVTLKPNTKYVEPGYEANDDFDGDITDKVEISREQIGDRKYQVNYVVTDSAGHKSEVVTRKVIVEEESEEKQNKDGVIYLTFDDGPSLDTTPQILDILKQENVKATFFIINYDENKEFLIKRIAEEGHTIGIHGYSHEYEKIYSSEEAYMNNILKLQEKIKNTTGITTKFTRFPGGSSNTISKKYCEGIMTVLTKRLLNEGFYYYDWNVSGEDSGSAKTKEAVYNNVINGLSKKRSNVVLLHDAGGKQKTVDALKDIIKYAKENGYSFDNIDESTPMITHSVNN